MTVARRLGAPLLVTALLGIYLVALGWRAVVLLRTGEPVAVALGLAILVLPVVAVAFLAREWLLAVRVQAMADELAATGDLPVDDLPQLPFDHNRIIDTAVKRLRDKSTYSALPCHLLPELFTLSDLQQTYEQILGHKLDKSAFRRKTFDLGFLEATSETRKGVHRPAQLHRIKPAKHLILFNRTI